MLLAYANDNNEELYLGFMDYEKAFDFANRGIIIHDLIHHGCGKRFVDAVAKMYVSTEYIPIKKNHLGDSVRCHTRS